MNASTNPIRVGDELPPLVFGPVNRATLALFAGASGDHNPIHIDVDFARACGMPDVFAHGMLGMAWLKRLLTHWVPQRRLRKIDVRFAGITHLGHIIHCRGKVVALGEIGGEPCARVEVASTNQYGETKIAGEAWIALA